MSSVSSAMRRARGRRHEFQRAHVVQAVGELDQENADVVGDRQQQLAQVLGLLGLARHQFQPLQLGETLHQRADLMPEDLVDFGAGGLGILDGVVQQRGDDGGVVELEVGENRRDFQRMRKIGIAGGPGLRCRAPSWRRHRRGSAGLRWYPGYRTGHVRPNHIAASCANAATWPAWPPAPVRGDAGSHGDRIGRGLHLSWVAAPIRHRINAFMRGPRMRPSPHTYNGNDLMPRRATRTLARYGTARFRVSGRTLTRNRRCSDHIGDSFRRINPP